MSFAQINVSSVEGHTTDAEALLQTPSGEAVSRVRVKLGIAGSVILVGAALIFVVAPVWRPVSTSIDVSQSVISLDGLFTSPYYYGGKSCPEGEYITTKENCRTAGAMLGYGDRPMKEKDTKFWKKACSKDFHSTSWNANSVTGDTAGDSFCQLKPENMPDFAALKADLQKLTFHCLDKTGDFGHFKRCMHEISSWSDSDEAEAPSSDDDTSEAPLAPDSPDSALENECWRKSVNKFSGGYAGGVSSKFDLEAAKVKCLDLGSGTCGAVTCSADGSSCTVRKSTELKPSPGGEVSYQPC